MHPSLRLAPMLCIMGAIFFFSHQPGDALRVGLFPGADKVSHMLAYGLLAAAVMELFPDTQCGIGPPTDDGFFYDFLVDKPFTPEDLKAIEKKMAHIVKQNRPIEKKLIPKAEALELFEKKGQTLKCELIREKAGDPVQCYTMGDFVDFCLGPHLASTKEIKASSKSSPSTASSAR